MPFSLDPYLSEPLQRSLIPALLTVIVTVVGAVFSARPRIKWGVSHGFVFDVQNQNPAQGGPPFTLFHTRTVFVQNTGRATAEGIEVHFSRHPEHMQIWPTFNYTTAANPENHFVVLIENLGRREHLTLELLSMFQLPDVLRVRSKVGEGRQVGITSSEVFPAWYRRMLLTLIWLGMFAIIQNVYLWIYK
jgi:hypothetical protein